MKPQTGQHLGRALSEDVGLIQHVYIYIIFFKGECNILFNLKRQDKKKKKKKKKIIQSRHYIILGLMELSFKIRNGHKRMFQMKETRRITILVSENDENIHSKLKCKIS